LAALRFFAFLLLLFKLISLINRYLFKPISLNVNSYFKPIGLILKVKKQDIHMKMNNRKLIINQFDKKMQSLHPLRDMEHPKEGWINLLRKTLNMSLRQLGQRLSVTPQGMKKIEKNEAEGGVTINALKDAAGALGMKLVYGFVPKDVSLEKMIEKQATEIARKIVMRTSNSMKLEDQENSSQRIKNAITELTEELKREMPKTLWD
jgi:predicted DNA-binding mobile mystery protein A